MQEIRTCIACRKKENKQNLIRIVAVDNVAVVDETKKANTRGMYICNNKMCINKLLKAKSLIKVIRIKASEESLRKLLENLGEN